MSSQITEAFVQQFRDNFLHLAQQKESRLESCVRVETNVVGVSFKFDRIGATSAQKKTTRHGDTPLIETPHSSRFADLADHEWADLIDNMDKAKMLADPTSDYLRAGHAAMNRSKDDVIIVCFGAAARSGVSSTVALPAGQKIAHGGAGLTKAKLITAKKLFRKNEADQEAGEELYLAYGNEQLEDLLNDTTLTNTEYNTVLSMVNGTLPPSLFGFKPVPIERLPLSGGIRNCYAWAKSGVGLAIGVNIQAKVSERADKSYSVQPYICMSLGAVRIEDEKVVEIGAQE